MARSARIALTLGSLAVVALLTVAVAVAAVGDTFYNVNDWRTSMDSSRQLGYVAGVYDAVQMIATGSGGNPVRIAQCLDRFQRLSEVREWVAGLVATRGANINVASIMLVNACP